MYVAEKKWLENKVRFNTFLWNIYGVGFSKRKTLLKNFGVNHKQKMGVIRDGSIYKKAIMFIDDNYTTEKSLSNIREQILIRETRTHSLRGWRMSKGLPTKGQNSHTNGATAARLKMEHHYSTKKERFLRKETEFTGPNKRKKLRLFFKKMKAKAHRQKGKGRGFKGRNYQKRRGRKSKGKKKTKSEQRKHKLRKKARNKRNRRKSKSY